ncbi:histidinolphosphatase [Clydaea vesicula]|uniref:Histidinol-phosphatase n=1 Tax=Clydaea vesicula TaxID=447962 RepID=A0AAD5U7W8_9FUNG|nr:histidinolphosphatase [Clydaea vesicula]
MFLLTAADIFSEHIPRFSNKDLYPDESELTYQDLIERFNKFIKRARELKLKYKNEITLLIGMETEYIVDNKKDKEIEDKVIFATINEYKIKYCLDYVVGSENDAYLVHHGNGYPIDYSSEKYNLAENFLASADLNVENSEYAKTKNLIKIYFQHQYQVIKNLNKPDVIGHFDLCRIFRKDFKFDQEILQQININLDLIKKKDLLIEINSRAWKKNLDSAYPFKDILRLMIEKDIKFTLSDDAHGPDDVGMHYDKLYQYLNLMNINRVYSIEVNVNTGLKSYQPYHNILENQFWKSFVSNQKNNIF